MDLYKYTLKGMQQNSNSNDDEERKRKQRELEQRTREQETKRRQEKIDAQTKAMEELAKADAAKKQLAEQRQVDARNKKFTQVEEIAHPTTNNYSGGGRSFEGTTSSTQPLSKTSRAVNSLPQSNTRQAYKNWYENDYKVNDLKKYNDYGRQLRQDFRMSGDYAKANRLSEQDTIKLVTPESDTRLEDRLESIAEKVRNSDGNNWLQEVGQSIQEGWYEKEVYNMLSKEAYRQLQGLPNKVDKVNKFIEDNPDLFTQENGKAPYQLLRGSTGVFRQGYDNIKETFQDPGTYLVIAGIYGMSYASAAAATAATGGVAALPAFGTATAAATKASTLYALSKGMSYGSFKNMSELEAGSSYLELREEGVPHEIAKPIAQTVGAINGMIEFAQIDTALGMIPGFDTALDAVKQQATKDATKKVMKVLGNYGVDLGSNIVEELLQGSYSYAGVELGKYLKDTPEPNTMEALESMGKMFSDEEYWREMKDTAKSSFYSFALTPVLSSSARYAGNEAIEGISNRLEQNYVNEYSDEDFKAAQRQRENLKEVITAENGITDKLIQRVNETLDPEAIALLVSEKQVLQSHMNRADATNQEKALFQDTVDKVNNVLSKVMYDAKDENPNIEYRPTNRQDVESEVATLEFAESSLDTINPRFNVTAVEYYNLAKDSGALGTIKAGLKEGKEKSKIVNEITKSLPKKERSPINVMAIVNAVETVESEIDSQIVMNNMYNLQQVQENLPDISVDANVVQEESNENVVESTEQPVGEEIEGSQPTSQIEVESPTEELTEPTNNIETEIDDDTTDIEEIDTEATEEYTPSSIIKVPVNKILVDAERFQFRYEQGSDGTTTRLADTEWNQDIANADNVLLWEDEYGDLYMVNGHHRLSLAKANGVTELNAKVLSSKDVDAETARATGAMINIAQGHATSIDVAKVIKDIGITLAEMQKQGIPPKSKIAKDGYALSQLEDWLFTQVATRAFPIERAVIIGNQLGDNKAAQRQIVREVMQLENKGKTITNGVLNELISATKGTAQVTGTQQTLMGEMEFIKDVGVERAELADYVKTQLRSRVSVLKNVTKEKNAKMLEELGNTIALDDNVKDMNAAEQALWIIDKTLNYQGTKINELFNELAQEFAQAEPKDRMKIKKKVLDLVTKMMEGGNLLSETINQRTKREDVKDSITRSKRDGAEGIGNSSGEQFTTREQEELVGQASILQMKEMPQVEVTTKSGAKSSAAYKATVRIVEALQKNVFFNGLKVDYTNETGKVNYSKEELIKYGYGHLEENKEYVIYGQYDNGTRTITLNQGATRDTILEEAIHDIQARIGEINPTLGVLITEWENEVKAKALEQGIEIPDGYELLAKAMVYSELGYASTDKFMAETIAVDDDIASGIKSILGDEVLAAGIGLVESKTDKADRVLRAEYKDYADRIFMQDGFLNSLQEAQEVRMNEIKTELENAKAIIYHHPSNGTYVIVSPSTKGAKYQVTYFDREGPFMDTQNENIDDIAKSLADEMYFYKGEEIHYQLKKVNRSVADELYGIAISRGYRADNNRNGNRISFRLTDNQIVNAYHDAKVGNFSAQDFDELIKDNKDVLVRVKNDIIRGIFEATKKGLDVDNSDVTFLQYLHRFYGMPIGKGLYKEDVITYKNGKIIIAEREYAQADREEILAGKDPFKDFEIGNSDTLEKALDDYKMWMNRDVKQTLSKDFIYLDYKELEKIEKDYENFRDNIETYRNKGIETEFTGEPHYAISYQLKEGLNPYRTEKINPLNGEVLEKVYKGFVLDSDKRIKTGNDEWDGYFFVADNSKSASAYGQQIEEYTVSPGAKILYEGTKEFKEVTKGIRNNISMLEWANTITNTAKENGYDAVWFDKQTDIGTAIINRDILNIPDNLKTYQLKAATDTPEFKKWFKDSKVVDENGDPLVVYHGTRQGGFDQFSVEYATKTKGIFFSDDYYVGRSYAGSQSNLTKLISSRNVEFAFPEETGILEDDLYYISSALEDVYDITLEEEIDDDGDISYVLYSSDNEEYGRYYSLDNFKDEFHIIQREELGQQGIYDVFLSIKNPYIYDADNQTWNDIDGKTTNEIVNEINEQGIYDGVIFKNLFDSGGIWPTDFASTVYVVFNPTQIKSIYNNGTFNEYDPNINYQLKSVDDNIKQYSLDTPDVSYNAFVKDNLATPLQYNENTLQGGYKVLEVDNAVEGDIYNLVVKDAVMGGYDYLKMADNEPIEISNKMIEKVLSEKPLFQLKEEGSNGSLLAMHNIDKNKLKNAIKLGGFPMPSIAVAKKDLQYTDFGNITLLFNKDTIDPQASKLNKVYSGDAYTPVFPTVYYKVNSNVARKLSDMVYDKVSPELRDRFGSSLDEDNISYKLERRGSFEEAYNNDVGLMIAYLNEKDIPFEAITTKKDYGGWEYELLDKLVERFPVLYDEKYIDMNVANEIAPELTDIINENARETFKESFPDFTLFKETMEFGQIDRLARNVYEYVTDENRTVIDRNETEQNIKNAINEDDFSNWLEEISEGIIEKTGFRNNKDMFTPSGNRRKWETLHEEVTLDNVVRAMKQEPDQAAAGSSGIGQFMAVNSQEFKSLQHIRDSIDMLVDLDPEEFKELREEYSNRLFNIANKIKNPRVSNQFMALDSATDILIENIRDYKTKPGIIKALRTDEKSGYISLSNFSESELFDLIDDVKEMPTQYFEAKPGRAVRFNEVQAALIDESRLSGEEELTEIKDMLKSVGVNLVETYSEDNRQQAIDRILRQNDVSFQLKEADTNTKEFKNWFRDSKVVDDEGKPLVVYHGSPSTFTEFRPSTAPGWGKGIYFTDNAENATEYAYSKEGIKPLYEVYLSIDNPYTDETRLSDDDIENTRAYKERQNAVPMVDGEYDYEIDVRELFGEDGEFANDVIRELGYDGIVTEGSNNINGKEIVVFDPTQIKSVYNYGAWDVNDPNIYYQLKEEPDMEERSWGQTIRDANITEQWLTELLASNKFMYEVKHNQDTMIAAAQLIDTKGEEYVEARLLSDLDNDAVLMAASQILTYKYMESGEQDRAMTMLDKTAEKATSLGQAIQILSVWGRQTPEGMLRYTSQAFRKVMTDNDRQVILDKTKALTEEFNKLNRQAIKEIDLVGTIKQVQEMKPDERLARDIASKGETLPDGFTSEMLKPFENTIDDDMAQRIIDVVNRHYQDGKGNLKYKLGDLGLNDFETEILDKYIKQKVKEATKDSRQATIDKELKKQKYERKGIDEQILDLTSEGKIDENLLKNLVGEKEGMPVLNKELVDYIYQQGQYINSLPQGRERDIETGKMIQTISDQMPVSFWTKVKTFQTIAQLLNFKTTIRNLVGNDMFRRLDTFTLNFLGTPIDAVLAKATGHSRTMLFRPINANKAQKLGYKEGWRLGLEDALLGINTSDENTQYELRRTRVFTSGILGEAEKVLNIALRATDRAAVMATFRDSLAEQMELAKVDVATDEMTENAMAIALYRTFQDDTTLSQMFSTLKRGLNKIGSKDGEFGLGELIMKYPKTPANILGRAIDYSPAGVVVTALKLARDTSPKGSYVRQRMAAEGLSRAIMGTGLIATGAILAKMGILTGSNPDDDEDIYKLEKQYGLRDFSVNVSALFRHIISGFTDNKAGELKKGDRIASYDWAEPIAMGLAIGADTELGSGEAMDFLSTVVRATETGTTALADQPLLTGIANLFRYGDPVQGMTQVIKSMPSSFTPTLFSHVAQFVDGRDTDPYSFYGTGQQAWNLVANRIPGLRNTLPGRYSVLGDEKRYYPEDQNLATRALNIFLNPSITSEYMPTDEAQMIFDLYESSGNPNIVPRQPQKTYTIDKQKYSFTPESWEEMSKWLGSRYRKEIGSAMNSYMRSWSPEEQADEIEYLIKQVKEEARKKVKEIGTKVE